MAKLKIDTFIDPILNYINTNPDHQKYFDFTFKAQKYEPKLLLKMIGIVLKEGLSWRSIATFYGDYEIFPKWQTVYAFYKKLINKRIILSTYVQMLKKYYIKNKNGPLKYRFTDTSFIYSRNGGKNVKFNKYFGRKKCCKLSLITDANGIPYNIFIGNGNTNDCKILMQQINTQNVVNIDTANNFNYFMADSGYDTKEVRDVVRSLKFIPLIPFNKRNTKDTKKINKMPTKDYILYKKRIKIEHVFGTLKNNKKLLTRYEKLSETFLNFIYIHFIKVLSTM